MIGTDSDRACGGKKAGSGADDLSLWQYDSREGSHCEAGFSVAFGDGRIQQT